MSTVLVSGAFDNFGSRHVRFLAEAARLGSVQVALWPDRAIEAVSGGPPRFPEAERRYLLQAIRYVDGVSLVAGTNADAVAGALPAEPGTVICAVQEKETPAVSAGECRARGWAFQPIGPAALAKFPDEDRPVGAVSAPGRKKVLVTGCFDWFHSGHVRFFEEVADMGDLYVVVGHDANIRLLKGEGHPLFPAAERRYLVQAVRYVHRALVSSGEGWMDAAPEIERIRPDIYAVNEDGDRPEKAAFCARHGLDYRVLKRLPKEGLPRRQSTDLRGF